MGKCSVYCVGMQGCTFFIENCKYSVMQFACHTFAVQSWFAHKVLAHIHRMMGEICIACNKASRILSPPAGLFVVVLYRSALLVASTAEW